MISNLKFDYKGVNLDYAPLWLIQQLIKWNFDLAGLIEKGEAIPVTNEFNPYAK